MTKTKVEIVVGLGFGDEGKGTAIDWLVRQDKKPESVLVVRFNGGCQAAHNVVLPDGTHHKFAQIGSGALAGASTHLSRFMVVDPMTLRREFMKLVGLGGMRAYPYPTVDRECLVTTIYHVAMNRLRESVRGSMSDSKKIFVVITGRLDTETTTRLRSALEKENNACVCIGDVWLVAEYDICADDLKKRICAEIGEEVQFAIVETPTHQYTLRGWRTNVGVAARLSKSNDALLRKFLSACEIE